jgi:two-component system OmpR family response regulator
MTPLPRRKDRILIVDDNKQIRDIISKLLAYMGYEVVSASDGHEALRFFIHSPFKLVITDLSMPQLDGLSLASFIKDRAPHTVIILMTGNELETKQEGSVDFVLTKPFSLEDLEHKVQMLLPK